MRITPIGKNTMEILFKDYRTVVEQGIFSNVIIGKYASVM
jgi:hypothetical protein